MPPLAQVLSACALCAQDGRGLTWLDPPPERAIREGRAALRALGATAPDGSVNTFGKQIARLAAHPKLASMVIG